MKSRVPQGYGNQPSNMNNMIKQAQKMQDEMAKAQDELDMREFCVKSGGGAVEVVMTGNKAIKSLTINPDVVNKDEIEMLQDLVIAAVNEVIQEIETVSNETMEKISGGITIPGMQ